ncbi:uncharacterized protein BROUX77_000491 [Berkeleyomyces rouxiae]|uniref:uncharacterized protein n=1 Tax=Berkeleyomyces rouxiae TaxID=2035830 RepID=UPI003B770A02
MNLVMALLPFTSSWLYRSSKFERLSLSAFLAVTTARPLVAAGEGDEIDIDGSPGLFRRLNLALNLRSQIIDTEDDNDNEISHLAASQGKSQNRFKSVGSFNSWCLDDDLQAEFEKGDVQTFVELGSFDHILQASCLIHHDYKPISLSSYGNPIRFSSVWAREPHGSIEYIQGVDYDTYSAWLERGKSLGYMSIFVTVTGANTETALFSGVMEEIEGQRWDQLCDVENIKDINDIVKGYDHYVVDIATYGTPTGRKFCILVHENHIKTHQTTFLTTSDNRYTVSEYSGILQEQTSKRFWHPTRQYLTENQEFIAIFQNTHLGKWKAFYNLNMLELEHMIADIKAEGLIPIDIQGGGISENEIVYNAVFAELATPKPIHWTVVSETMGFQNNEGITASVDKVIKDFMVANRVRQAQFSAAITGKTIIERAYTLGEDDYPTVTVNDPFMIASLSKMFLNAAIDKLIQQGLVEMGTRVYEKLGYTAFADGRSRDITVKHLLDHIGSFDRSVSIDPLKEFREVAIARELDHAATLYDMIEYMIGRPLDFTPGTKKVYGNYGHMLLSYLVTNITKMEYYDFLKTYVLDGEDVRPYATGSESHIHDNFIPDTIHVGLDARIVNKEVVVSGAFGGDGFIKEEGLGTAGLSASASTIARFIGSHSIWNTGGREIGRRDGVLNGARSFDQSRLDGIDLAIIMNTREFKSSAEWGYLVQYSIPKIMDGVMLKIQ